MPSLRFPLAPALALLLTAVVALTASCQRAEASAPTLRLTAWPDASNLGEPTAKQKVLAEALSGALGIPVEYVPAADYAASYRNFTSGKTQLAWFGGVTGVQARHAAPGAEAIACGTVDRYFRSYLVANGSLGLSPGSDVPEGLRGKRFTFGRANSMSGRVMPQHLIRTAIDDTTASFFGEVLYSGGSHESVARDVESGAWDAGALNFRTYEDLVARGEIDPAKCVKLWETPPYHNYSWNAHPSLNDTFGPGFVDQLKAAMVAIDDPMVLDALGRPDGMVPTSNIAFEQLTALCQEFELVNVETE